ncbi:serine/threonine-protein kinase [Streptomyces sp. NPDC057253]|uniref:serine/threonine-protein kinase n=1 Tax=Streptomyces sp. NPDC057253 TaxID=3346069 RepID=UPI00362A2D7A
MSADDSGGRILSARPSDPSRVGPYRIIGRLGAGGMGTVHAGLDPAGVRVAIKVIHAAQAEDPEFRARFRREVQLSARVHGPCLIPLLAADPEAAAPWLATEYAPGPTLNQHLSEHGPLTGGMLYAFAAGTAHALAAVHQAGVVHRDVKPQNVILTPAGPRVLDFGIAHAADGTSVTRTGVMTGTPGWISPEHYRTGTAGPAGDMFAWGALVAYAATGRLPFGTGAPDAVAYRVMSGDPDLDGVPAELLEITEKALAKDPDQRITASSAAEKCSLLLASQATQVIPTEGARLEPTMVSELVAAEWDMPSLDDPTWQAPAGRRKGRTVAVIIGAAVVGGALIGGLLSQTESSRGNDRLAGSSASRSSPAADETSHTSDAIQNGGKSGASAVKSSKRADSSEATLATWKESRPARTPAEHDTSGAMGTGAWLDPVEYPDQDHTITFHEPRSEVYIATSGQELSPVALQEVAQTACLGLRDVIKSYPEFPYNEYVVVDTADRNGPTIVWEDNFRTNTACSTSIQNRSTRSEGQDSWWQPTESGLEEAQIPSTDKDEIRVASQTANAIISEWQGNSRIVNDPNWLSLHNMSVGFAPDEAVMYVWANKPGWDQLQRDRWASVAASEACQAVLTESRSRKEWRYSEYAVAIIGNKRDKHFLRWGSAGSCTA